MVFARVTNFFTTAIPGTSSLVDDGRREAAFRMEGKLPQFVGVADTSAKVEPEVDDEAARPPYIHVRSTRAR